MDYQLINNTKDKQYEIHVDSYVARIVYELKDQHISLTHTVVPNELGGKGIGSSLLKKVLEDIESKGYVLIPICSFIVSYIEKHPEWKRLMN